MLVSGETPATSSDTDKAERHRGWDGDKQAVDGRLGRMSWAAIRAMRPVVGTLSRGSMVPFHAGLGA